MFSTEKEDRRQNRQRSRRRQDGLVRSNPGRIVTQAVENDHTSGNVDVDESLSWDEMIFENRNKEYGAYVVRKGYFTSLCVGVTTTMAVVGLILAYPLLSKLFRNDEVAPAPVPRKLVYTELSAPPPLDKPKPPPPAVQLPRLKKVIRFVPPKVVREEIVELPPTLAEIKKNEISAEAVDGPEQVIFDEPATEIISAGDDELFTVVDQQPEYAGGYEAMMAFIQRNMQYPTMARKMQIQGTVHVSFIVSKTGAISDVKVLRGMMKECDQEAVRVVSMMPPWIPGKQNGRPVNVRFILPLKFRLN